MPVRQEIFEEEPVSPFFKGFEKLCRISERKGMIDTASDFGMGETVGKLKMQARVVGNHYYFDSIDLIGESPRSRCLMQGLAIGMVAGYLTVPLLARTHFLQIMIEKMNIGNEVFGSPHTDTDDLEKVIEGKFLSEDIAGRLPKMDHEFLDWILQAGVGWAAQQVDDYHYDYLQFFRPRTLWRMRNAYAKQMQKDQLKFESGEDFSARDFVPTSHA